MNTSRHASTWIHGLAPLAAHLAVAPVLALPVLGQTQRLTMVS